MFSFDYQNKSKAKSELEDAVFPPLTSATKTVEPSSSNNINNISKSAFPIAY